MPDLAQQSFSSFLLGLVVSSLYFGGLWLNIQHIAQAKNPQRSLFLGQLLRAGFLLGVFLGLLRQVPFSHSPVTFLSLSFGFLVMRNYLIFKLGLNPKRTSY